MALDLSTLGLDADKISEINAELDRARTQASQTARENAEKAYNLKVDSAVADALKEKEEELKLTQAEQLKKQQDALNAERAAFETEKRTNVAQSSLRAAGYDDDAIATLSPMFIGAKDVAATAALVNSFLSVQKKANEETKKNIQQQLLQNVTPPAGTPVGATVDNADAAVNEVFKNGGSTGEAAMALLKANHLVE